MKIEKTEIDIQRENEIMEKVKNGTIEHHYKKDKYYTNIKPNFDKIKEMIIDGVPEYKVAKVIRVSNDVFNKNKRKHKEFFDLVHEAKTAIVEEVEGTLYKKARGFFEEEVKTYIEQIVDVNGELKDRKRVEKHKKYFPPSDSAIQFVLKNLSADKWKDRQEVQQNINQKIENIVIDIENDDITEVEDKNIIDVEE